MGPFILDLGYTSSSRSLILDPGPGGVCDDTLTGCYAIIWGLDPGNKFLLQILDPDDTFAECDGGSRARKVHSSQHCRHPGQGGIHEEQVEIQH